MYKKEAHSVDHPSAQVYTHRAVILRATPATLDKTNRLLLRSSAEAGFINKGADNGIPAGHTRR